MDFRYPLGSPEMDVLELMTTRDEKTHDLGYT